MQSKLYAILVIVCISVGSAASVHAQSTAGRIAFGFDFGLNKLYGDFRDNQFWLQGDIFARWNIIDYLSLHVGYGGGQMRMKINNDNLNAYPLYFGALNDKYYPSPGNPTVPTDIEREEKNKVRHGGFQAMLGVNLFPLQQFVPWAGVGIEILNFEPRNLNQDKALPYLSSVDYSRNVLGMMLGIGFELYLSDYVVFNGKGVYHMANTPWLDDFTTEAYEAYKKDGTNAKIDKGTGSSDAFLTFGIGFSYYIFGDQDADKDGLRDGAEMELYRTDPQNPDTDGDGLKDGEEVKDYKSDPTKTDTDADGLSDPDEIRTYKTNPIVADADGDGLNDGEEIKAYKTNPTNPDSEGDGLNDGQEVRDYKTDPAKPDTDGDGLKDGEEARQYSTDPLKTDSDGDGLNDGEELLTHKTDPAKADTDGDGVSDGLEINTYRTNPVKIDSDGDGLNDGEEINQFKSDPLKTDTDGDGLNDGDEGRKLGTSPTKPDSDGDGLVDGDEVSKYKTDPAKADTDGDGLNDGVEINQYKTDPIKPDTDGDGLSDGDEITANSNPLKADSDDDGLSDNDEVKLYKTNPAKSDTDSDGWNDKQEVLTTLTDPRKADTDGDGVIDPKDACPLTKGSGADGCPPKPKVETVTNFPGIIFIVNTDNFDLSEATTMENLQKIRGLVEQCADIKVEIEGHASSEGDPKRNQELSEMRAARVKTWLIEQGVKAEKITNTIGYGSSKPYIPEPKLGKKVTAKQVEAARKQNRRIAVRVVETCK